MDVYLMQHGAAVPEDEDPTRPLTPSGRATVERVAARARAAGVRTGRCVHSGKLRAEQTARILADAVGGDLQTLAGLNPSDRVEPAVDWLREQARIAPDGAVAVVGHLPFLDRLTSLLVAGDADAHVVRFQNGGLVKVVPDADGTGHSIAWVLAPDLA